MPKRQKPQFKIIVDEVPVLKRRIENREAITGPELAKVLRGLDSQPLPDHWRDYICDFLEGKIKGKRGRKPAPKIGIVQQGWFQKIFYEKYFCRVKLHKNKRNRFTAIGMSQRDNTCYRMPANEIAARLVARQLGLGDDAWRTLQNNISSQK